MKYSFFLTALVSVVLFSSSLYAQDNLNQASGYFEVTTTSSEILGQELSQTYEKILNPDEEIKWAYYVPKGYDATKPQGIMVYVTQNNLAKMPFGWESAMNDKNLIWISLHKTRRMVQNKDVLLTVLAAQFIQNRYNVNSDRIYTVGQADGCFSSSAAMQMYPDVFKGAIYSTCQPINWRSDTPDTIEKMRENRYYFISSSENDIKQAMRRSLGKYKDAGIDNVEYLLVPKLRYGRNPDRRKLKKAIDYLDTRD
ncbi:MAG: hypothetical protein P8H03_01050 [Emcibacteraceae bacterium]|nr:hypothetical protein [Emcibacteraceae bacterium]MDG1858762.1 hypothetical protein [Emcibacteraceae bacterium]